MENCKTMKIKFDMMSTLKNLIKIFESKIEILDKEEFCMLKDLYV